MYFEIFFGFFKGAIYIDELKLSWEKHLEHLAAPPRLGGGGSHRGGYA